MRSQKMLWEKVCPTFLFYLFPFSSCHLIYVLTMYFPFFTVNKKALVKSIFKEDVSGDEM